MATRPRTAQSRIYGFFLLLYPPSFRREYKAAMLQAFNDLSRDRGTSRTWLLLIPDLFTSLPQLLMEASLMSQKLMATLTALAVIAMLSAVVIGAGPPILLIGAGVALIGLFAVGSSLRRGRPSEYLYGGNPPKRWTWWTVLAALLGALYVLAGIGQLIDQPKATNVGALVIAMGFAGLIGSGLWLRSRSRISGNWLVIIGCSPTLMFFWLVYPTVVALAVIVGAVAEIARATPKAPLTA